MQVNDNVVSVLTNRAVPAESLDAAIAVGATAHGDRPPRRRPRRTRHPRAAHFAGSRAAPCFFEEGSLSRERQSVLEAVGPEDKVRGLL